MTQPTDGSTLTGAACPMKQSGEVSAGDTTDVLEAPGSPVWPEILRLEREIGQHMEVVTGLRMRLRDLQREMGGETATRPTEIHPDRDPGPTWSRHSHQLLPK